MTVNEGVCGGAERRWRALGLLGCPVIDLPRLGLGCAALGNHGRERTDDECSVVLEAAWEAGVRQFDTAPHYGLGLSELRLGRFLATKPRDQFVVSTKVGRLVAENPSWDGSSADDEGFAVPARLRRVLDYSAAGVRASLDASLERLGLDRVDVLYVHDPERSGDPRALDQALTALAELRDEGIVRAVGTGSMVATALAETAGSGLADVLMVAGRYTLLDQSVAPGVLEACTRTGTRIVAAAVFNSGLLARTPRSDATYDYEPVSEEVLARAVAIDRACARHGVELATAAVHYPLLHSSVTGVVLGADTPRQVRENVARLEATVPDALWSELAESGLVPRCA